MKRGYALKIEDAPVYHGMGEDYSGVTSRVLIDGESGCMFRGTFQPGGYHARHIHKDSDEFVYIISCGKALKGLGDEIYEMEPGMCFYVPKNTVHWMKNLDETTPIEVVGVFPDALDIDHTGYEYVGKIHAR